MGKTCKTWDHYDRDCIKCKKTGAYRIADPRVNLDYMVSTWGGVATGQFNNITQNYLANYPVPLALQETSGNVGFGSKMLITAVADRDGHLSTTPGFADILDEISTFVLGDDQCLFKTGAIPVYAVGS